MEEFLQFFYDVSAVFLFVLAMTVWMYTAGELWQMYESFYENAVKSHSMTVVSYGTWEE